MPIYMNYGGAGSQKLSCEEVQFVDGVAGLAGLGGLAGRDKQSGQATGKRQWGQVKITHSLDGSTPSLLAPLVNQVLHGVQLQFTKTSPDGKENVYHVINLGDTKVVGVQPHVPGKRGFNRGLLLEYLEVDMTFRQISLVFNNGGKTFKDDWK